MLKKLWDLGKSNFGKKEEKKTKRREGRERIEMGVRVKSSTVGVESRCGKS